VTHPNADLRWSEIAPRTARRVHGGAVVPWRPRRVLDGRRARAREHEWPIVAVRTVSASGVARW
jgi:hypothetical protein